MASLPKPNPETHFLTLGELEAIKGTPEFEVEYGRQLQAVAEHYRRTKHADLIEPDWKWLDEIWK